MGISRVELYVHLTPCIRIEDGEPTVSFLERVSWGSQRVQTVRHGRILKDKLNGSMSG